MARSLIGIGLGRTDMADGDSIARAWVTVRSHLRESAGLRLFDQWFEADGAGTVGRAGFGPAGVAVRIHDQLGPQPLCRPAVAGIPGVVAWRAKRRDRYRAGHRHSAGTNARIASRAGCARHSGCGSAGRSSAARFSVQLRPLRGRCLEPRCLQCRAARWPNPACRASARCSSIRATGQGKSHLMHAIGAAYLAAVPNARRAADVGRTLHVSISSRRCATATRTASRHDCVRRICCWSMICSSSRARMRRRRNSSIR